MLFNSYIFIFAFLPFTIAGWYILNNFKKYESAKVFLAGMSLAFYAYFNISYLLIIVGSIFVNFGISLILKIMKKDRSIPLMIVGIIFNLAVLFYYKYYDFFISNINGLFKTDWNLKHILLPLGISFFTFQQLSYVIDRCRGKSRHFSFVNYITFVTFFPQLIAGPIVLYDEMMPQFESVDNRSFNYDNFLKGALLFSLGLGKKVLLADVLANVANYGFANVIFMDSISTFLCGLAYAFELYFDFSGYSDMAIGLGRMFNIELPQNFNSPYKAASMKDLWQRWHITLSRFFVQYVYIPLGGSRRGKARTMLNLFIIFMLSGLWHGAAWTYIMWGVIQGIAIIWDNLYIIGVAGLDKKQEPSIKISKKVGQFITFNFFLATLYVFRCTTIADAIQCFKNMLSFNVTGYLNKMIVYIDIPEIYVLKEIITIKAPGLLNIAYLILFVMILLISVIIVNGKNALSLVEEKYKVPGFIAVCSIVFIWSVVSFSQVSTFIYFNF